MPDYRHAPTDYDCPFCKIAAGGSSGSTVQEDVVFRDEHVTVFIAAKNWPNNKGHVLIIPNMHYENVYELPDYLGTPIHAAVRRVALAMKIAYGCDGISTRQHNEPDGNQDVWHFHTHVYPRYRRDKLYLTRGRNTTPENRRPYADKLRAALAEIEAANS